MNTVRLAPLPSFQTMMSSRRPLLLLLLLLLTLEGNMCLATASSTTNNHNKNATTLITKFSVLLSANPQYVSYDNVFPPGLQSKDDIRRNALRQLQQQYHDMNQVWAAGYGTSPVLGAVILGDLTATGNPSERRVVQKEFADLTMQIYPGLGHLDYAGAAAAAAAADIDNNNNNNNDEVFFSVGNTMEEEYAKERHLRRSNPTNKTNDSILQDSSHNHNQLQMIKFMYYWLRENSQPHDDYGHVTIPSFDMFHRAYYLFPSERVDYYGSLSYSFTVGGTDQANTVDDETDDDNTTTPGVHFIQLHNYPTFARTFQAWDKQAKRRDYAYVRSSLTWFERDLALARNRGEAILVLLHNPTFHNNNNAPNTYIIDLLVKYQVSAVVVSHLHDPCGLLDNALDPIPVFLAGSASYQQYLVADMDLDNQSLQIRTRHDPTTAGAYEYQAQAVWNISLQFDVPHSPLPVPPPAGTITFYCDGGFVAMGEVSYTLSTSGESISQQTHNLALGNMYVVFLPPEAMSVHVKGYYVAAGLHKIVDVQLDSGVHDNICFRMFGTLFKRHWDHSCGGSGDEDGVSSNNAGLGDIDSGRQEEEYQIH